MKYSAFFICLLLALKVPAQTFQITSPDGKIRLQVNYEDQLSYSASFQGKTLISDSPLGFEFKNEKPMGTNLSLQNTPEVLAKSESWTPVVKNKHDKVTLNWNEATLNFREKGGDCRQMDFCIRVYDNGIAFRYQLYGVRKIGNRHLTRELTGFSLPESSVAWVAKYKRNYTSSQESEFVKTPLSKMPTDTVAGLPFLVEIDKQNYVAITEAYIDDYPGKFIESELIAGLNPPCAIEDMSWIKPGMAAWDHWWSGEVKMEMDVIKEYIDLASIQGWPYMVIDWQWYGRYNKADADITKPAPQLDMQEILEYARLKNVRCWLWLYCTDINKNDSYKEAFALYEKWGIAGVKIDFMDRDDQEMVNWYRKIVTTAAKHKLMVDFHGSYKPDGIERTYPNLLTREGVMGEEYSKFTDRIVPEHNVTLAFTRMLAGPMDYTPGGFLNVPLKEFKKQSPTLVANTRCAELSKFVIYESPFTVVSDHPKHILGQQGADFLKVVPTVWDDTRFLDGYPGEFIALAKRSNEQWFVGVMNNSTKRVIKLDTSFLPEGEYELEYWKDAKNADKKATELVNQKVLIVAGKPLTVKMVAGGGYVGILTPVR